jgi:hypothetical protein
MAAIVESVEIARRPMDRCHRQTRQKLELVEMEA